MKEISPNQFEQVCRVFQNILSTTLRPCNTSRADRIVANIPAEIPFVHPFDGRIPPGKAFLAAIVKVGNTMQVTIPVIRPTVFKPRMTTLRAAQLENALLKASHNGHWHDAEVKVHGNQLVITHEDA